MGSSLESVSPPPSNSPSLHPASTWAKSQPEPSPLTKAPMPCLSSSSFSPSPWWLWPTNTKKRTVRLVLWTIFTPVESSASSSISLGSSLQFTLGVPWRMENWAVAKPFVVVVCWHLSLLSRLLNSLFSFGVPLLFSATTPPGPTTAPTLTKTRSSASTHPCSSPLSCSSLNGLSYQFTCVALCCGLASLLHFVVVSSNNMRSRLHQTLGDVVFIKQ